jgi:hypothetical protein
MKNASILFLALGLAVGVISGCATNDSASNSQPRPAKPSDQKPAVGMTKAQILEMYGKTDNVQASSAGETWVYQLNMGEAFIPFNFGYRPKTRIIIFNGDGIVTSWSYTQ